MEWKGSHEKKEAYMKCADQASLLPNWLQGTGDYFGESVDVRGCALDFILTLARRDNGLHAIDLIDLIEHINCRKLFPPEGQKVIVLKEV